MRAWRLATRQWRLAIVVLLASCATVPEPPVAADGIEAAFVVLGPVGAPMARAIASLTTCPPIVVDGVAQSMTVRLPAATIAARPTITNAKNTQPARFPVLTCEFPLPPDARTAMVGKVALPLPKPNPQRILLLGDTGCRLIQFPNGPGLFQACNDPAQWPFRALADNAARMAPDLVIHVGDYHYREAPCPPFNAGCAGSPHGYGWDVWRADFFAPAKNLLAAAPWIVVRGNHESCSRAGQGWWRFMDPRRLSPGQDCNDPGNDNIGDYSSPYFVPIGTAADGDAQFIVFDSSRVSIAALPLDNPMYRNYHEQFVVVMALASRKPQTFFVNHHPILGFAANPENPQSPFPGNAMLQSVLSPMQPIVLFPPTVQALVAGHNHAFEVVDFSTGQPPQFIVGNGGDWVDEAFPSPFPMQQQPAPGAVIANFIATNRFGFMTMERDAGGWTMKAWDVHGAPVTTCTLAQRVARCAPLTPALARS